MKAQVVSFKCILKNKVGSVISTTFNRDVITSIGSAADSILSGLVQGLQNLQAGEKRSIAVMAEQAYGFYDPKKVVLFPRKKFGKKILNPGEVIAMVTKSGFHRSYRVAEVHGDMVALDGNHPLAGQDLIFEIETLDVREATTEEMAESKNSVSTQVLH